LIFSVAAWHSVADAESSASYRRHRGSDSDAAGRHRRHLALPAFDVLICRPSWYSTIRDWESRYQTSIFSSGISHVDAQRALGVTRLPGAATARSR